MPASAPHSAESVNEKGPITSRRVFLKRSAGMVLFLGVLGGGRHLFRKSIYTKGRQWQYLEEEDAEMLTHLAEILLPPTGGFPTIQEVDLIGQIDKKLGDLTKGERKDLKSLFFAFNKMAPILGPALGTFVSMSDNEKIRYVQGWQTSRLDFKRTGFIALKQLSMLLYYTHEKSWPAIDYKGPWVGPKGLGGK